MRVFRFIITAVFVCAFLAVNVFANTMAAAPAGKSVVQNLRWKGRTIRLAVSTSLTQPSTNIKADSDVMNAVRRSLRAWQSVADIEFELESSDKLNVSPSGAFGDGVSLITIASSAENVLLFSNDPLAESAKTRVFYNPKGFITEADIVLNPYQQFSADGTFGTFDLEATLTHEIGHLLGLRHSAVLSATMSDTLSRNGTFGFADLGARTLAESDISAVREIYGAYKEDDTCCAVVNGRLSLASGKPAKDIHVWAEEKDTGIVMAQVDTTADGKFRIGGLPAGDYKIYWQTNQGVAGTSMGELAGVMLETDDVRLINEKISLRRAPFALNYVGVNRQLAESPVNLDSGREYTIFVGGKNLDAEKLAFSFDSPFFKIIPNSFTAHDFGDRLSVLSFVVRTDDNTPSGDYSIFAGDGGKSKVSLIGAINVE